MFSRNAWSKYSRNSSQLRRINRSLATEASTSTPSPAQPIIQSRPAKKVTRPTLSTAIVLTRAPLITRTPSLFEQAYYAYQARVQRALHNPFPYDFYFKQGSPLETRFNAEELKRERKAFGKPFGMPATGEDGDGKLTGTGSAAEEDSASSGLQDEDEESISRIHPSDVTGDVKSLDRKGQRHLYLLVKTNGNGKEQWAFPQGGVEKGELLHEAAARDLTAVCGPNMDTWIVSRQPIGVYNPSDLTTTPSLSPPDASPKAVTFFYKAHILSGQVRTDDTSVLDFAWLTKEELESRLEKEYWLGVKDMLSDF